MMAGGKIDAAESERVAELLRRYPLPQVKNVTGWSYRTLARIAQAVLG